MRAVRPHRPFSLGSILAGRQRQVEESGVGNVITGRCSDEVELIRRCVIGDAEWPSHVDAPGTGVEVVCDVLQDGRGIAGRGVQQVDRDCRRITAGSVLAYGAGRR